MVAIARSASNAKHNVNSQMSQTKRHAMSECLYDDVTQFKHVTNCALTELG